MAQVTANPQVDHLLTGHFREKNGYRVLRPLGTSDWLLIYTISGAGEFGAGEGKSRIVTRPGDAVLLRPGTLHDYKAHVPTNRWELLWAHFHPRPDWRAWLDWPAVSPELPRLMRVSLNNPTDRRNVAAALKKMNRQAVGSHRLSKSMAMNAMEEALLWCAKQIQRPDNHDPRIEHAEAVLCQNLAENITLDQLAEVAGLSVSRLSYLFKQQTGVTPQQYYEMQRLERAKQLLEMTSLPIKSIAAQIGFNSPFYFTLRFKRFAGKSPRDYRASVL